MYWISSRTPRIRVYSCARRLPSLFTRDFTALFEAPTTRSIVASLQRRLLVNGDKMQLDVVPWVY
jgi:hypothetical protein